MNEVLKQLLGVYKDNYQGYMYNRTKSNQTEIVSREETFALSKFGQFQDAFSEKDRVPIVLSISAVSNSPGALLKLNTEFGRVAKEVVCMRYSANFFETITQKLMLGSFSKNFKLNDSSVFNKLKAALDKAELPFIKVTLDFQLNNKSVFKIPADVFKEIPTAGSVKNKKMYAGTVSDWYIINHLRSMQNVQPTFATLSNVSINLKELKIKNKKTNVIACKDTQNLLEFIQYQINAKCSIYFRLKKGANTTDWVKVEKTETDVFTKSVGLYFEKSAALSDFTIKNRLTPKLGGLEKYIVPSNSKLSKATHFIPEKYQGEVNAIKFNINAQKLIDLSDNKSLYNLAVVESKTRFFNLYFDVDLDWKSFEVNKDILQLKKLQFSCIAGSKSDFSPLTNVLAQIYPYDKVSENVNLSARKETKEKSGFHLVYKKVILKNNEVQLKFLYDSIEKYFAKEMIRKETNETIRFLLQAVLDEISISDVYAPALDIDISRTWVNSLNYAITYKDFKKLLANQITVSLRSNKQQLSKENNEKLIVFALHSIGEETLNEFFAKYDELNDKSQRFNVVLKIAKRIRWEIMRKIHFFDHTAAKKDMGLRMVGNVKPNDPNSKYIPQAKSADTKSFLENHSIRSAAKQSSVPASFHYNFLQKIERLHLKVTSLKGLFFKEVTLSEDDFYGLDIEFKSDKLKIPKELVLKGINQQKITAKLSEITVPASAASRRVYDPVSVSIKGNNHWIYPPKHRKKEKVLNRQRMLFSNIPLPGAEVKVRVRVFIPAPIVDGPFLKDFGGDGRGPSYDAGTSRLDMDIVFNPVTGTVESKQADWGYSHSYDPDTTNNVPGKPDWWLVTNAPALEEAKLETKWGENVKVGSGSNNGNPVLEVHYSGALPLESLAPAIDGNFILEFDLATGEVTIDADHDGFPQHTLYINEQLVYNHDPVAAGEGPTALGAGTDIQKVETIRTPPPVPGSGGQSSAGGDDDNGYDYDNDDFGDDYSNEGGSSWEETFEVVQNDDGSVEISSGDNSDTMSYDDEEGTWESENGMSMEGEETSFEDGMSGNVGSSEGLDESDELTFTVESTTESGEHTIVVSPAGTLYP